MRAGGMFMRNKLLITAVLCMVFSLLSLSIGLSKSYACDCVKPPSVEDELERSQAVFSGKVLEVNEMNKGYMKKRVLLEVTETWKGISESQVIITTGSGGGDCGYEFQVGEEYLVYAHPSSMYGEQEELVSIICDRTTELSTAQEDLAVLGEGKAPTKQVDLTRKESNQSNFMIWMIANIALVILAFIGWRMFKNRRQANTTDK